MVRLRRMTVMATIAAASALALAACGSSSDSSSASGSSPSSAGSSASESAALAALYKGNEGTPPSTSPPAAKGKTVWWISCGQVSAACSGYAAAGQKAAEALGWTFKLADGNLNQANGEATALRTAIAAKPDAIILDAFGCSGVQPELQQAKSQGIPVMGLVNTDCDEAGTGPALFTIPMIYSETYPTNKAYWIGWGDWSGQFVAADAGGKTTILAAYGKGDAQFDFQKQGFEAAVKKNCAECTIIPVPWTLADLGPNGSWLTAMRNALVQHPDAGYVWFPFDFNTVESGGAKVVLQSGSKAKVISNTGFANSLDLVRAGQVYAEASSFDTAWTSWAAMDQVNRYFNKQPSVPQGFGYISIDKNHNLPATPGQDYKTSVDYQNLYKQAWGVS